MREKFLVLGAKFTTQFLMVPVKFPTDSAAVGNFSLRAYGPCFAEKCARFWNGLRGL